MFTGRREPSMPDFFSMRKMRRKSLAPCRPCNPCGMRNFQQCNIFFPPFLPLRHASDSLLLPRFDGRMQKRRRFPVFITPHASFLRRHFPHLFLSSFPRSREQHSRPCPPDNPAPPPQTKVLGRRMGVRGKEESPFSKGFPPSPASLPLSFFLIFYF